MPGTPLAEARLPALSAVALVPVALLRGIGADSAAAIVAWTVAILVSYAGVGIAATAQAVIFRRLTGWRPGTTLPERS